MWKAQIAYDGTLVTFLAEDVEMESLYVAFRGIQKETYSAMLALPDEGDLKDLMNFEILYVPYTQIQLIGELKKETEKLSVVSNLRG